jgi:hypothetical protein
MGTRSRATAGAALALLILTAPGCHRSGANVVVPPGDAAVLAGAVVKKGKLEVQIGWPATATGEIRLFLVAVFGTTADQLDDVVSQMAGMVTGGFNVNGFGVTDNSTGNGVFMSFARVVREDQAEAKLLDVPRDVQGTGPVTVRLYAQDRKKLLPRSNAVQIEYSAPGKG